MERFNYLKNTKLIRLLAVVCADADYSYTGLYNFVVFRSSNSKQKKPLALLKVLQTALPFSEEKLSKLTDRAAYVGVFGKNTPPNERALDNIVSDLYHLVEEYLVFEHAKIQPFTSPSVFLLQYYAKNRLNRNFGDYYREIIAKSVQNNSLNTRIYYELFAISQIKFDFQLLLQEEQALDPQEVAKTFHLHLVADQLRQAVQTLNYQQNFSTSTSFPFLDITLAQIKEHPEWLDEPLISIYYYVYQGLVEKKVEYVDSLLEKLSVHENTLQRSELGELLIYAANIIIYIINVGNKTDENYRRMFNVYKKRQELGLIYEADGSISPHEYKNIVVAAILIKELGWANDFNEKHYDPNTSLAAVSKVYFFNRARIAFERKEYKQIFNDLLTQDFKDDILDINTEVLLIKALYEQAKTDANIYENLGIRLNRFQSRLKRNKTISAATQNAYLQFANTVERIIKMTETYLSSSDKKIEKEKIRNFITETPVVVEQRWLLEKVK